MDCDLVSGEIFMNPCKDKSKTQKWEWEAVDRQLVSERDAAKRNYWNHNLKKSYKLIFDTLDIYIILLINGNKKIFSSIRNIFLQISLVEKLSANYYAK